MGFKELIESQYEAIQIIVKWRIKDRIFSAFEGSKLKNKNFSILGNNCVLIGIYHKFGLPFSSPTIGLFFFPEDYIKFLENLNWYLKQPIQFSHTTKHISALKLRKAINRNYPIGILGDIEIHFMHYTTQEEALEKWNRRLLRINYNNLFILFSDSEPEEYREELLERFERLPFEHKIFFSSKPNDKYKSVVFVEDYAGAVSVNDLTCNRKYEKYIDLVKWLNGEKDFIKKKKQRFPNFSKNRKTSNS
jgi:uncharacterized protein (DUF1919 family)